MKFAEFQVPQKPSIRYNTILITKLQVAIVVVNRIMAQYVVFYLELL